MRCIGRLPMQRMDRCRQPVTWSESVNQIVITFAIILLPIPVSSCAEETAIEDKKKLVHSLLLRFQSDTHSESVLAGAQLERMVDEIVGESVETAPHNIGEQRHRDIIQAALDEYHKEFSETFRNGSAMQKSTSALCLAACKNNGDRLLAEHSRFGDLQRDSALFNALMCVTSQIIESVSYWKILTGLYEMDPDGFTEHLEKCRRVSIDPMTSWRLHAALVAEAVIERDATLSEIPALVSSLDAKYPLVLRIVAMDLLGEFYPDSATMTDEISVYLEDDDWRIRMSVAKLLVEGNQCHVLLGYVENNNRFTELELKWLQSLIEQECFETDLSLNESLEKELREMLESGNGFRQRQALSMIELLGNEKRRFRVQVTRASLSNHTLTKQMAAAILESLD